MRCAYRSCGTIHVSNRCKASVVDSIREDWTARVDEHSDIVG